MPLPHWALLSRTDLRLYLWDGSMVEVSWTITLVMLVPQIRWCVLSNNNMFSVRCADSNSCHVRLSESTPVHSYSSTSIAIANKQLSHLITIWLFWIALPALPALPSPQPTTCCEQLCFNMFFILILLPGVFVVFSLSLSLYIYIYIYCL